MYTIEYAEGVVEYLRSLRTYECRRILDTIDEQLTGAPTQPTRNKKILIGLKARWEHEEPMWELRVGHYRVFYDVNEAAERVRVMVCAARAKTAASDHRGDAVKTVSIQDANLRDCLKDARREGVVITRRGKPVALLVGVEGLDLEQIELGHSDKFWRLARKWRGQKTISRAQLEKRLGGT